MELLIVVVVIAILAAITIVAYSGISQQARTSAMRSEIAQWKKKSELHKIQHNIECPDGYVFVYGNSVLGTSDFCVMKYEAKEVGGIATSQADGTPWVSISQTDAITRASEACNGCHLITEAEWMTIAADVLSVKYNWSGWTVGSGYIYSGHNDNVPANALTASTDDEDGYMGTGNGSTSGASQKRTLYLTSGDVIWDLAGNVYEWTQQSIGVPALAMSQIGVPGDSTFSWREWTLGSLSSGNLSLGSWPGTLTSSTNAVTGATLSGISGWDASHGVGRIYANHADVATRAFRRGGDWNDGFAAGVLSLYLHTSAQYPFPNLGFRVAK